jgi:glycosyltransferase involved in cell wall biosynthesis
MASSGHPVKRVATTGSIAPTRLRYARAPAIVGFHGSDATKRARSPRCRRQYRRRFRDAARVIAPSQFLAGRLRDLGCPQEKLQVSPNDIDPDQFSETRRTPGQEVAIDRLVEKTALDVTIRAVARVYRERPYGTLAMVGDGALRGCCEAEIMDHGLEESVELFGSRGPDAVKRALSQAQVFDQHSVMGRDGTHTVQLEPEDCDKAKNKKTTKPKIRPSP